MHHATRCILIGLSALLLAACASDPAPQSDPVLPPAPRDPALEMSALATRIGELVMAQRTKINPSAQPLAFDFELAGIARRRSQDLAQRNTFANPGDDTHVSATMLMDEDAKFQGLLGENIAAQHYEKQAGIDVETFAERFVDGWLASKPHKDNLAFTQYNRTGVGASVNGDTIYVVELFATDLGLGPHIDPAPKQVSEYPDPGTASATGTQKVHLRGSQGGP